MKYLLDTNICIYAIKKKYDSILANMKRVGIENIFVSSVSIAELEFGISKSSKAIEAEQSLYEFLVPFDIVDFDSSAARKYGKLRRYLESKGRPIGPMDLMIASIGLANDMVIVTNNSKEFMRVLGLELENWSES